MSQDNYGRIPPSGRPWWLLAHVTQQLPQNKQTAAFSLTFHCFPNFISIKESPQIVFLFFIISFEYAVQCSFMELLLVKKKSEEK